jgi:hypothetical protein
MNAILKRDITIPAGTVFQTPNMNHTGPHNSIDALVMLGQDSFGILTFPADKVDQHDLGEWFDFQTDESDSTE